MFKKDCKKEFKEAKVAKSLNVKCVTGTQEVVKLQLPKCKGLILDITYVQETFVLSSRIYVYIQLDVSSQKYF